MMSLHQVLLDLHSLDRVKNAALLTCLETFGTSPIHTLYAETGELPLHLQRQQLIENTPNPAFHCFCNPNFCRLFELKSWLFNVWHVVNL